MSKSIKTILGVMLMCVSISALSSVGVKLDTANTDISDNNSLQNGAKLFMNYCSGCHSLSFMRYNRLAEDLNIPKEDVVTNLMFNAEKIGDTINATMPTEGANKWFGGTPPDLSLVARYKGVDWIYTYLRSFYPDDSRPYGVNNHVFQNVSMPDILLELKRTTPKDQFNSKVRDIVNFLDYVGEPAKLVRSAIGTKVLAFLLLLLVLAYLLKKEYWKDVKYGKWRAKD